MLVKKLKEILSELPDDAEILLAVNGHSHFTDTETHGASVAAHVTMGNANRDVFVFSATNCGFDPRKLNFKNIKLIKRF